MTDAFLAFEASYEHKRNGQTTGSKLVYTADNIVDAAKGFMRFWENRHAMIPEFFEQLYAVKIHIIMIGPINDFGVLTHNRSILNFEWKCDMGWTYDQRVSYLDEQIKRAAMK
jgi:hypothetical protein